MENPSVVLVLQTLLSVTCPIITQTSPFYLHSCSLLSLLPSHAPRLLLCLRCICVSVLQPHSLEDVRQHFSGLSGHTHFFRRFTVNYSKLVKSAGSVSVWAGPQTLSDHLQRSRVFCPHVHILEVMTTNSGFWTSALCTDPVSLEHPRNIDFYLCPHQSAKQGIESTCFPCQ